MTEHTPTPWRHVELVNEDGTSMTPDDAAKYVANTAKHGRTGFHAIQATKEDGKVYDVCHVGNGPDSPWNAAQIASAVNSHKRLRELVKELSNDLENEVEARRSGELDRRIERDLIVVREARAMLAKLEGDDGGQ